MPMRYLADIKYMTVEDVWFKTLHEPANDICTDHIEMFTTGMMLVRKGYGWDGPSGPMIDSPELMYPSLGHDALYDLHRRGLLSLVDRELSDQSMDVWMGELGVSDFRRKYVDWGLAAFGEGAASPEGFPTVLSAPTPD